MKRRIRMKRNRPTALALAAVTVATGTAGITGLGVASATPDSTGGSAALNASDNRVSPRGEVTLNGRFPTPDTSSAPAAGNGPANDAQPIRIQFRALGAKSWQDAEKGRTGRSGKFSERVVVTRSGRFRALSSDGRTTKPELVEVKSKTDARISNDDPNIGDKVTVRGHVAPAGAGRKVAVDVGDETLKTHTRDDGSFRVKYEPSKAGDQKIRVRTAGNLIATGSGDVAGKVTVFRPAGASYYGPGLYGNGVACGGTLQPDTIGVANKTLPCGTKLTIRYGNEEVKNVEVIDRGPYVAGREFDLTEALRNKLGFGGVGTVYVDK